MTDPESDALPAERSPRQNVLLSAEIERFGGGAASRHRVRNLSASGVRIDQAGALTVGATVLVSVGTLAAIGATVMWVKDGSAGLRFAHPIDPDAARAKVIVKPDPAASARTAISSQIEQKPTAGWVADLNNPYLK